jgi:hypothetical protein
MLLVQLTRFHPVWIMFPQGFDIFLQENCIVSVVVRYDTVCIKMLVKKLFLAVH